MKNEDVSYLELKEDMDKCYIDPDGIQTIQSWLIKLNLNDKKGLKKAGVKKIKHLTTRLSRNNSNTAGTNEVFWENKNEVEIARKEAGASPLKFIIKQCLGCAVNFQSEGKHNRMCDGCRLDNGFGK